MARADQPSNLPVTLTGTAVTSGATGQGVAFFDTYPGSWISVSVTGLGAGSASASFALQQTNHQTMTAATLGWQNVPLMAATANGTATLAVTAVQADGAYYGPIRARYGRFVTSIASTAGPGPTATAAVVVFDNPLSWGR